MKNIKDAIALVETGQVEKAHELLQITLSTASDEEKFVIVELYEEWGFIEDAIEILESLLEKFPTEGQLMTKLAELSIEIDDDERAINLLNNIEKDDPFYVHALLLLADAYEGEGLVEVAEQKLLEAREVVNEAEAFIIDFALGELLLSMGQAQRAIVFYEKVLEKADDINGVHVKERLAESFTLLGKYKEALACYDEISYDDDLNLLFKHGFVAYRAEELQRASDLWERIIDIDPYYHPVYYELATVYTELGLIEKAYNIAKEGLKYDEFDKRLFFLLGKTSLRLGDETTAIKSLEEAIALDEDYKEAILLLATVYEDNGDFEQMLTFLQYIKQLGGTDPIYDWKLANAYNELEKYEEARSLYDEVYFHLASDSDFLKEYGYFLVEDGAIDEGIKVLTKYINKNPDDGETIAFMERIHFSIDDEI